MDAADSTFAPTDPRDALVTTSLDGRVLGWSRGAQALFGWREREILGRPFADLIHEKHRANDAQTVAEAGAGKPARGAEQKFLRRDGAVLACVQTVIPRHDAAGRVRSVIRIVFDLSALKESERALHRMRAQLAELARGAADGGGAQVAGASELSRTVRREVEQTREHFLRVVEGLARELGTHLCSEVATAAADARVACTPLAEITGA